MITNHVTIERTTADEAPNWNNQPVVPTALVLKRVIIVKSGMESGLPTLDFVLEDEKGNQYVTLLTGGIFRSIAIVAKNEYQDGGVPLV